MSQAKPVIAVLDDDENVARTISRYLRQLGAEISLHTNPRTFLAQLKETHFDIVISDLQMPDVDGFQVLEAVRQAQPTTEVIVITGHADKESAIRALKAGAYDFFEKPVDEEDLLQTISRTVRYRDAIRERNHLASQVSFLTETIAGGAGLEAFIGAAPPMQQLIASLASVQKTDKTAVLIMGESGTGKELAARAIHYGSQRAKRPFVPVNCSAIPEALAESILFGHLRGSFTGATTDKKGSFQLAHGGTLFLDEIGDMPAAVQTKLLRVLEDHMVTPVGSNRSEPVDVRIVAATNASLDEKIQTKAFRQDLYYRLAAFVIQMPPLRDHREDIPALATHFIHRFAAEMGVREPTLSDAARDILCRYHFPGNVRELRNLIERAMIAAAGGKAIQPEHIQIMGLPGAATSMPGGQSAPTTEAIPLNLADAEKLLVQRAMTEAAGNVSQAARLLGISRANLYRKLPKA